MKVFMGSSTGTLLVPDDATLERVLRSGRRRVAVHAEDEPRLRERLAAVGRGHAGPRPPRGAGRGDRAPGHDAGCSTSRSRPAGRCTCST